MLFYMSFSFGLHFGLLSISSRDLVKMLLKSEKNNKVSFQCRSVAITPDSSHKVHEKKQPHFCWFFSEKMLGNMTIIRIFQVFSNCKKGKTRKVKKQQQNRFDLLLSLWQQINKTNIKYLAGIVYEI